MQNLIFEIFKTFSKISKKTTPVTWSQSQRTGNFFKVCNFSMQLNEINYMYSIQFTFTVLPKNSNQMPLSPFQDYCSNQLIVTELLHIYLDLHSSQKLSVIRQFQKPQPAVHLVYTYTKNQRKKILLDSQYFTETTLQQFGF